MSEMFWRYVAAWNLVCAAIFVLTGASTWWVLIAVMCAVSSAYWSAEEKMKKRSD